MNKVAMTTRNFYVILNEADMIKTRLPGLDQILSFDDLNKTG